MSAEDATKTGAGPAASFEFGAIGSTIKKFDSGQPVRFELAGSTRVILG